ncbi:unnamed protein product, partial [Darwinula stevensoni]
HRKSYHFRDENRASEHRNDPNRTAVSPSVAALYKNVHPEYPSYLYLVAPISLVFLNPIGILFLEIQRQWNESSQGDCRASKASIVLKILSGVALNPIVFMTVLGIAGNFIFKHCLPPILEGILKVLGSAFSATALFVLGLRLVGKVHSLRGPSLVVPGILICVKTLISPLLNRELMTELHAGSNPNETMDLSNYGFLYGTFPTAPTVFVYAAQYNLEADLIASAMVMGTFLSAPLMFVSAKMVTLKEVRPADYIHELSAFLFNISIIGLICCIWVLAVFVSSRKWRKIPHFLTLCLIISQMVACIGVLLWSLVDCNNAWKLYLQFFVFAMGVFSSRVWTALLALSLLLLRFKRIATLLRMRPVFAIVGWGIPLALVSALLLVVSSETKTTEKQDPNFQYGRTQAIVAALVLSVSLLVTVMSLIMQQRLKRRYDKYEALGNSSGESTTSLLAEVTDSENDHASISKHRGRTESLNVSVGDEAEEEELEALFSPATSLRAGANGTRGDPGSGDGSSALDPEEVGIVRDRDDEFQVLRHVILLLVLSCSMIVVS